VTGCPFPQHHKTARGGSGPNVLILVAALLVMYFAVRVALVVAHFLEAWWWTFALAAAAAAVVWVFHRGVASRPPGGNLQHRFATLRHLPRAAWAAARWHHLTRNLGLAYPDKHVQGKVRRPRAVIRPAAHGIVARVRTVPGTGRAEFDQAAEHISNAWRVQRVSVSQPRPGRVVVRGLKRDPLLAQFGLAAADWSSADQQRSPRRVYLGRDEHGSDRYADLANCPGICVGGMPGAGKSTELTAWLTQLAPSPAVQFALADGKGAGEFGDFADRAWLMAGDDLDDVVQLLEAQHALMTDRLAAVRQVLGVKNAWHKGPSEAWPLAVTVLDECQSYFDLTMVKGDRQLEPKVRRAIFLTSSLIRRGRSVMMLTIPATQKPTTDSLPSSIRDNCPVSLCFAVKTMDAAKATLGQAIADFPSYSPLTLQGPEYAGCCTATLRTGQDPFTRLRGPWVGEDQAAAAADASAHLRKDPRVTAPVVVPDDARELVPRP
jgi:S-DNA-T family DNA segregation ATPase FtsK/SpoIIIE